MSFRLPRASRKSLACCWGLLLLLLCLPAGLLAQRPLNLDFELPGAAGSGRPWGWSTGWWAFGQDTGETFALDSLIVHEGRFSLRVFQSDSCSGEPQALLLQLPADFARGHQLSLTAWLRTEDVRGTAQLNLEGWKPMQVAFVDSVAIVGSPDSPRSSDWTRFNLGLRVPDDPALHSIAFTVALSGPGRVWFDGLALSVDGRPMDALPTGGDPPDAAQLAWLAGYSQVLDSVDPAADASDLALFRAMVGDARLVGLGESTHGTREFFRLKHRLLRFLVMEAGFRAFAIEANQAAVEQVNDWIQGGPGRAEDVMRTLFKVWNTEEVRALVQWLRDWNLQHPGDSVRFLGYDMQDNRVPADSLRAFLADEDPGLMPEAERLLGEFVTQPGSFTPDVADSTRARWYDQTRALCALLDSRASDWLGEARTGHDSLRVAWALQNASLLSQAARLNASLYSPDRDSLMAANLDWALRVLVPGRRTVIWAHDMHISRGGDPSLSFNAGAQMGAELDRRHGADYRAFSLLTWQGWYSATRSMSDHRMVRARALPAPAGSAESVLHELPACAAGIGCLVDLRPARQEAGGAWLRQPRPLRSIGYAAWDWGFELQAVLPLEFDGVFLITDSSASHMLR